MSTLADLKQTDSDNLADIIWFIRGYNVAQKLLDDTRSSDLCEDHVQSLKKFREAFQEFNKPTLKKGMDKNIYTGLNDLAAIIETQKQQLEKGSLNDYGYGIVNGLILAQATLTGIEPVYMKNPEIIMGTWKDNKFNSIKP